jgi:hypothetical protein
VDPISSNSENSLLSNRHDSTLNDAAYNTCLFDQVNTVACPSDDSLIALDATTGHRLWSLPDARAGRISPALHVDRGC